MNNQSFDKNYIDVPLESFSANHSRASTEPKIKQEIMPMPNIVAGTSRQILSSSVNPQMDLTRTNDTIEYISNDMDDDNIQGIIFSRIYRIADFTDVDSHFSLQW